MKIWNYESMKYSRIFGRTATNQSPWAVDFKLSLVLNQMTFRIETAEI
jgi:hypothetical protein